jgi:hypothetical protein
VACKERIKSVQTILNASTDVVSRFEMIYQDGGLTGSADDYVKFIDDEV